ncbi:MAG: acetyl/propionyl/methylcrotonyl-CoA carboxylase subunit alpha [Rhodospirillales bacterium]
MFQKILIANRGEIACRVIRTARKLGVATVALYSDADAVALHVALADEAWRLGPAPVAESYLKGETILEIARASGAQAIHPGYGFLSENAGFAEACEAAGIVFIGPPASAIRAMGLKDAAKALMEKAGVPVVPGYHGQDQDPALLAEEAARIGYPVLIKAVAGGGGKGMRKVDAAEGFAEALASAQREGQNAFGDPRVLIEKYVTHPRHVEIQVFADGQGEALSLFERDCSLQRRHQKVIEEAPAPGMPDAVRRAMGEAAVTAAKAIGYRGAGTVEFIADGAEGLRLDGFWFMEMNTRLQVEHPVTEMITGQDLVAWQLEVAAGGSLPVTQEALAIRGHAFEARIYAEDPAKGFLPSVGRLSRLAFPEPEPWLRVDSGVREGDSITSFYDPMIAKLIVQGETRSLALARLARALEAVRIEGCTTNTAFLAALARHEGFASGAVDTGLIDRDLESLLPAKNGPAADALAAAALFAAGALDLPKSSDPWDCLSGFRLWDGVRQIVHLDYEGETLEGSLAFDGTRYALTFGEITSDIAVVAIDADSATLDFRARRQRIELSRWEGGVTVFLQGRGWRFGLPDRSAGEAEAAAAGKTVVAPMSGRILLVKVAVGDSVTRGQVLAVEEAMKMEHSLTAPRDGVVEAVRIAVGDQVEEGTLLIALADEEEGPGGEPA